MAWTFDPGCPGVRFAGVSSYSVVRTFSALDPLSGADLLNYEISAVP